MTPHEKEELQEKILSLCNAVSRLGIQEAKLQRDCQRYGWPALTLPELQAEIHHLEKAGMITPVAKELRPDLRRWVSTASGDQWLMKQGLI